MCSRRRLLRPRRALELLRKLHPCFPTAKKSWKCDRYYTYTVSGKDRIGLILDNGCKRNVGGSQWHRQMRERLKSVGLQPQRTDCQEDFLFGSDRVDTSVCAWRYPVGIHGHTGIVNVAEIESNCPGLMSADTMARLDISIHARPQTYDIGSMNVWDYSYEISDSGHALLRTDQTLARGC